MLVMTGCGGLSVTKFGTAQAPPSNVGVFLAVEKDGKAVPGLTAEDFTVYEDGLALNAAETQVFLHDPWQTSSRNTLVLVDRSSSGMGALPADQAATEIAAFVSRVEQNQRVAVYAFDGEEGLHPLLPFDAKSGSEAVWAQQLVSYAPTDPSTNLNGGVVMALRELKKASTTGGLPIHFDTLIVIASGADRAGRHTRDEVKAELDGMPGAQVYAIGVGPAAAQADLAEVGRTGSMLTGGPITLNGALTAAAVAIEQRTARYYVVGYCTPARKGEHEVRIEVRSKALQQTGTVDYKFNADGMAAGCDARTEPVFAQMDDPSAPSGGFGVPSVPGVPGVPALPGVPAVPGMAAVAAAAPATPSSGGGFGLGSLAKAASVASAVSQARSGNPLAIAKAVNTVADAAGDKAAAGAVDPKLTLSLVAKAEKAEKEKGDKEKKGGEKKAPEKKASSGKKK
ncbi:MAG TPA: hypothetical protein VGM56_22940 [Byssovorax sp.]